MRLEGDGSDKNSQGYDTPDGAQLSRSFLHFLPLPTPTITPLDLSSKLPRVCIYKKCSQQICVCVYIKIPPLPKEKTIT